MRITARGAGRSAGTDRGTAEQGNLPRHFTALAALVAYLAVAIGAPVLAFVIAIVLAEVSR